MRQSRRHVLKGAGLICLGLAGRVASAHADDQGDSQRVGASKVDLQMAGGGEPADRRRASRRLKSVNTLNSYAWRLPSRRPPKNTATIPSAPCSFCRSQAAPGRIVLRAENRVFTDNDPTQHAEYRLISDASKSQHLTVEQLRQCALYTSAEPCAMCCGAMFWADIRHRGVRRTARRVRQCDVPCSESRSVPVRAERE